MMEQQEKQQTIVTLHVTEADVVALDNIRLYFESKQSPLAWIAGDVLDRIIPKNFKE